MCGFQGDSYSGHWQDVSPLASGPSGKEALPVAFSGVCLRTPEFWEGIWSLGGFSVEF